MSRDVILPFIRTKISNTLGQDIENAMYEYAHVHSRQLDWYEFKYEQLLYCMQRHPQVFKSLTATYTPHQLVWADDAQLRDTQAVTEHALKLTFQDVENEFKISDETAKMIETQYVMKCRDCHSTDITWRLQQTRSADEAMTAYCTCNSCGSAWIK